MAGKKESSNQKIGRLAEEAERERLLKRDDIDRVYEVQNKQGHGIDVVGVGKGGSVVVVVEVKANTSRLSEAQEKGGEDFFANRLTAATNGASINKVGR
ncbi:MAG: hypothetical protein AAFX85_13760, partial [Pseudomonadota bacterium]